MTDPSPLPDGSGRETLEGRLARTLDAILRDIEGARSVVLGDASGLPIASVGRQGIPLAATAMATLAMNAADKVTTSLGLSQAEDVLIQAKGWMVLVRNLGGGITLSVVFPSASNLGLARLSLDRRAGLVREALMGLD